MMITDKNSIVCNISAPRCIDCEEVKKLKAENEELLRSQDILFLLLDLGMTAVEKWGRDNGLIPARENTNQSSAERSEQISVLLDCIRKLSQ